MKSKLGEIAHIIMGQSPKGEYVNDNGNGIPLLNGPTEFTNWHPIPVQFTTNGVKFSEKFDILFCVRGSTTGRMNIADQKYVIGRGLAAIRGKNGYPTLYVKSIIEQYLPSILVSATGSTFPNVSRDLLINLEIDILKPNEAEKVSETFRFLQEKININTTINQTLETIAQTLFKSWFVDFDPVKAKIAAKEEGEDPQLAAMMAISGKTADEIQQMPADKRKELADTADLFPDEMMESELGWIPKGWKVSEIGDYVQIKHGYAFKGEHITAVESDNVLLTPGNFRIGGGFKNDKFKYYNINEYPSDYILNKGDVIITMTDLSKEGDTLGYPAFVPNIPGKKLLHNQRLGKIINEKIKKSFLFRVMCQGSYRNRILGSATGSTVKHTSPARICEISFIHPTDKLIDKYDEITTKLIDNQMNLDLLSNNLSSLRDSLLPKLLSGEIAIN